MQNDVGVSVMPRAVDRRLDEGIGRTWKRHPIDAVVTDTNDRILETIFCKWIRSTTHPVCVTKEAIGHMHDVGVYSLPAAVRCRDPQPVSRIHRAALTSYPDRRQTLPSLHA